MHTELKNSIAQLFQKGNVPKAEILLRSHLENEPNDYEAFFYLGKIAEAINLPNFAIDYFNESLRLAPHWQLAKEARSQVTKHLAENQGLSLIDRQKAGLVQNTEKFILIKAWGYGFWSDVSHVLAHLLVAELTNRTPIVHWGTNSLFSDGTSANAFEFYFETFSKLGIADIKKEEIDIWPPKWNLVNLTEPEVNKWSGPNSRIAGLYLLGRKERLIVSDFISSVVDIQPWIPRDHHLHGLSIDDLWKYLVRKYLHPTREILAEVDRYYEMNFASQEFLAVHMRGSDKRIEQKRLDEFNRQYKALIDRNLQENKLQKIFLMTDDTRILEFFRHNYGENVITTNCQRTSSTTGVHYLSDSDKRQLGKEVMIDVYLAARAKFFVGNGFSNPSLFVRYLKDWHNDNVKLLGTNMFHMRNVLVHNW
jgi:hypothetical protein